MLFPTRDILFFISDIAWSFSSPLKIEYNVGSRTHLLFAIWCISFIWQGILWWGYAAKAWLIMLMVAELYFDTMKSISVIPGLSFSMWFLWPRISVLEGSSMPRLTSTHSFPARSEIIHISVPLWPSFSQSLGELENFYFWFWALGILTKVWQEYGVILWFWLCAALSYLSRNSC